MEGLKSGTCSDNPSNLAGSPITFLPSFEILNPFCRFIFGLILPLSN